MIVFWVLAGRMLSHQQGCMLSHQQGRMLSHQQGRVLSHCIPTQTPHGRDDSFLLYW